MLHLIVLDTYTSHVYLYIWHLIMFWSMTQENYCIMGRYILRIMTWKQTAHRLYRPAESVHVAFKAAVSRENIETSVKPVSRARSSRVPCQE